MTVTKRERRIPLKDPGIKRAISDWKKREKAKKSEAPTGVVNPPSTRVLPPEALMSDKDSPLQLEYVESRSGAHVIELCRAAARRERILVVDMVLLDGQTAGRIVSFYDRLSNDKQAKLLGRRDLLEIARIATLPTEIPDPLL